MHFDVEEAHTMFGQVLRYRGDQVEVQRTATLTAESPEDAISKLWRELGDLDDGIEIEIKVSGWRAMTEQDYLDREAARRFTREMEETRRSVERRPRVSQSRAETMLRQSRPPKRRRNQGSS